MNIKFLILLLFVWYGLPFWGGHLYKGKKVEVYSGFDVAKAYVALSVLFNQVKEHEKVLEHFEQGEYYFNKIKSELNVMKKRLDKSGDFYDRDKEEESVICQDTSYLKSYETWPHTLFSGNKIARIDKLIAQANVNKYDWELKAVQEEVHMKKKITFIGIGCVICFLGCGCMFLIALYKKEKIKKRLKEVENKKVSLQLENKKLEIDKFQMEIYFKSREILTATLMLAEKNNILKDILKSLEVLKKDSVVERKDLNVLEKQLKGILLVEDDWVYFKLHFEKIHPDYLALLKKRLPVLSENDLRLCAYIRIGMTNKQIAQILSVLPDTVNTTRYRIRKKIGLRPEETLEIFLSNFSLHISGRE